MAQSKDTKINIVLSVLDKFSRPLTKMERSLAKTGEQLNSFGQSASLGITAPLLLAGGAFVKAAADAEEMESRFRQVFGNLSAEASMFSTELGDAVGRSDVKIRDSLSTFQSFAVGMGFSREQALEFSKSLSTLSLDFASFNNISDGESQQRFISALSGSSEVLDRFGVNIKQSALDLELQAQGLAKSTQEATEQQKAVARLGIIMKAMTDQGAVGDAIRTQDSFTNQMKALSDAFFDFRVQLGRDIIPALTGLVTAAGDALEWFNGLSDGTRKLFIVFATFMATLGPAAMVIGTVTRAIVALRTAMIAARVASLALLGPWGLVIAAATAVAGVVGVKLFDSVEKTTDVSEDMKKKMQELAPSFDIATTGSNKFSGALGSLSDQAEQTAEKIADLQKRARDVFKDVQEDEADAKADLAEAIVGQEEKIADVKSEIRAAERERDRAETDEQRREASRRVSSLENQLQREQEALRTAAALRKGIRMEIQEAERRADLTDFERLVEDIQRRRVERLKANVARLQEIQQEIAAEKQKNAEIEASYVATQERIRAESGKTTDKIKEDAREAARSLKEVQKQIFTLGGTANSTAALPAGLKARASGGPVSAGQPYIVGERGPEVFTPATAGLIRPNRSALSGVTVNIQGGTYLSEEAAEQMGDMIMNQLKLSNGF